MTTTNIKPTYSLDVEARRALETLAQRWGVSKSEAVRRAIRMAAKEHFRSPSAALIALDRLQVSLRTRGVDVSRWAHNLRAERRESHQPDTRVP